MPTPPPGLTIRAFIATDTPLDAITPEGRASVIPVVFEDSTQTQTVNIPVEPTEPDEPEPPPPLRIVE